MTGGADDDDAAGRRDEDKADVQRVLSGDLAAFAGIVQRWQGRLVNLAWRFCRDRSMAEDMAQDAFVKAFKSLRTFRGDSAFSTWLTAIAMNTYRSALRDREPAWAVADPAWILAGGVDVLARIQQREQASALRQAVFTLPPRYREPIVLFYFNDLDLAETARVLGLPEGTVKARLHRGRELLRRRTAARFK